MVVDESFDVFHDLSVAAVGLGGHCGEEGGAGRGRLRMQDEGDGEEAFDEFDEGITAMGLAWTEVQQLRN